jgi:FtsP/CotA-like multicopper oxidase with cupredoxin domain
MPFFLKNSERSGWTRRKILRWGLIGLSLSGALLESSSQPSYSASVKIPPTEETDSSSEKILNPMSILRDFNYGNLKQENDQTVREFQVTAQSSTIELNSAINFVSWNLNNRVPGPTLRATEGDRLRIIFHNEDGHSHSIHFHGRHPAEMDGVTPIRYGKSTIYEFEAESYGVYPYHCHVPPITRHIGKGMYGLLIIDPREGRSPADEMVMVMGGYDLDDDEQNELYAFNGIPNYYRDHPIAIYQNQLVRIYLVNMVEFDPAVTFHLHANLFQVYRSGRTLEPSEETDEITMGTAERHIIEFSFAYPGEFMFHPHQDVIAENGCMGHFNVIAI